MASKTKTQPRKERLSFLRWRSRGVYEVMDYRWARTWNQSVRNRLFVRRDILLERWIKLDAAFKQEPRV